MIRVGFGYRGIGHCPKQSQEIYNGHMGRRQMRNLNSQDIVYYLSYLGQEISLQGITVPVRILMVGGGFILTQLGDRRTTHDIDVIIPLDHQDSLYQTIKKAIWAVADKQGIQYVWMNDIVASYVKSIRAPEWLPWKRFDLLEVYIPSVNYRIAAKLLAGRERDIDDLNAIFAQLGITTSEQAMAIFLHYAQEQKQILTVRNVLDAIFKKEL